MKLKKFFFLHNIQFNNIPKQPISLWMVKKRMQRFERVTELAKKLNISVFFEVDELVDKHTKLFEYY